MVATLGSLLAQTETTTSDDICQGCLISPDGSCVLTSSSAGSQLLLYDTCSGLKSRSEKDGDQFWKTSLTIPSGSDSIRSYAWYPKMNSNDFPTCCFVAACRDQPVHLWDAYTGLIRASYRPFNGLDEMESPMVVEFSLDGRYIWTGGFRTDRFLHLFDLAIPGRDSTVLKLGKTRRSSDGQKGLVSTIAPGPGVVAVGTYAPGSIYVYDDRASQLPTGTIWNGICIVGHGTNHLNRKRRFTQIVPEQQTKCETNAVEGGDKDASPATVRSIFSQARTKWFQSRTRGGVTQLKFDQQDSFLLYSASRHSDAVLSWDLRMISGNPDYASEPIQGFRSFAVCANTNQRLQFDVGGSNRLFVGGLDRCIRCYDTTTGELIGTIGDNAMFDHTVNGVSFHPGVLNHGVLAASTGSREFPSEEDFDQDTATCTRASGGRLFLFQMEEMEQ